MKRWLGRHERVSFHFTPTGASWMNLVECWFSILTRKQIRRGSYVGVPELIAAIKPSSQRTTSTPSPSSGRRAPSRSWRRRFGKRLRERNTRASLTTDARAFAAGAPMHDSPGFADDKEPTATEAEAGYLGCVRNLARGGTPGHRHCRCRDSRGGRLGTHHAGGAWNDIRSVSVTVTRPRRDVPTRAMRGSRGHAGRPAAVIMTVDTWIQP